MASNGLDNYPSSPPAPSAAPAPPPPATTSFSMIPQFDSLDHHPLQHIVQAAYLNSDNYTFTFASDGDAAGLWSASDYMHEDVDADLVRITHEFLATEEAMAWLPMDSDSHSASINYPSEGPSASNDQCTLNASNYQYPLNASNDRYPLNANYASSNTQSAVNPSASASINSGVTDTLSIDHTSRAPFSAIADSNVGYALITYEHVIWLTSYAFQKGVYN